MVGVGHLEVGAATREEHREDLLEVAVDRLEGHEEGTAHLAVDGRGDLDQRRAGALEVGHLLVDVVGALLEALVLLHGHLVDGADVGELLGQACRVALHGVAVLGLGQRQGVLEGVGAGRRDGGDGVLDLDLEPSGRDLGVGDGGLGGLEGRLGTGHLLAGVGDGPLERVGVGLGQAGTIAQHGGTRERALVDRVVAGMQGVDAQAQHLEGAGRALDARAAAVEVGDACHVQHLGQLVGGVREVFVCLHDYCSLLQCCS